MSEGYQVTMETSRQLRRKIANSSSLSQDEILQVRVRFRERRVEWRLAKFARIQVVFVLQLVSPSVSSLPLPHQQSLAKRKLIKILSLHTKEMSLYACM